MKNTLPYLEKAYDETDNTDKNDTNGGNDMDNENIEVEQTTVIFQVSFFFIYDWVLHWYSN